MATAVTTDEIYERYLRKAITEINRLSQEIGQAADGAPTALPTGHPLATIFLLKYGPQTQELQEGVAFHGRAGNALIKSLQRLRVDPMEVYGTNCVKFSGAALDTSAAWLQRELRIVQPRLVVVMGDDALDFLNGIGFPLSQPVESRLGELQHFTPTIEALAVPDIDLSLDGQAEKTAYWNAFKAVGPLVGSATSLLSGSGAARRGRRPRARRPRLLRDLDTPLDAGTWADVAWLAIVVIPGVLALVWLVLPLRDERWVIWAGLTFALLAVLLTLAHADVFANFARLGAATFIAFWFLGFFDTLALGRPRQLGHPVGRRVLGVARADEVDRRAPRARLHRALVRVPGPGRARGREPRPAGHLLLRAVPRRVGALRAARRLDLALPRRVARRHDRADGLVGRNGLPALPAITLGFLVPNADLIWRRLRGQPGVGDRPSVALGRAADDA